MRPAKTIFKDKSKTQQHMADDVNINKLVAKHGIGQIQLQDKPLQFLDLSGVESFHDMQNKVKQIEQGFMNLPAKLRGQFNNKSHLFAAFIADEKNHPQAWSMGLMEDPDGLLQNAWEAMHPTPEQIKAKSTPVDEPVQTTLDNHADKDSADKATAKND